MKTTAYIIRYNYLISQSNINRVFLKSQIFIPTKKIIESSGKNTKYIILFDIELSYITIYNHVFFESQIFIPTKKNHLPGKNIYGLYYSIQLSYITIYY